MKNILKKITFMVFIVTLSLFMCSCGTLSFEDIVAFTMVDNNRCIYHDRKGDNT